MITVPKRAVYGNVYENRRVVQQQVERLLGMSAMAATRARMNEMEKLQKQLEVLRSRATHMSANWYLAAIEMLEKKAEKL